MNPAAMTIKVADLIPGKMNVAEGAKFIKVSRREGRVDEGVDQAHPRCVAVRMM